MKLYVAFIKDRTIFMKYLYTKCLDVNVCACILYNCFCE